MAKTGSLIGYFIQIINVVLVWPREIKKITKLTACTVNVIEHY